MLDFTAPISDLGVRPKTLRLLAAARVDTIDVAVLQSERSLREAGLDTSAVNDLRDCLATRGRLLDEDRPALAVVAEPQDGGAANRRLESSSDEAQSGFIDDSADARQIAEDVLKPEARNGVEAEDVSERIFGAAPRSRTSKTRSLRDDERAAKFADRAEKRERRGPRLDDPVDAARIVEISKHVVMDARDFAWLHGVSRDCIYNRVKRGELAHDRFGDLVRFPTGPVLAKLFPVWPPPGMAT